MRKDPEDLFPTNPDLVDMLGDMNVDFEKLCVSWGEPRFLDFQIPGFQDSRLSAVVVAGYGWLRLGGGGGNQSQDLAGSPLLAKCSM